MTRSSSCSPARATRSTWRPGGIEERIKRPERPMLPWRSSST
jgi:hypothetical protein